ncbi:MAG: leucine-rich repeat protein [Clostridia bacterium]|nr:leucine-rich repeat protein [Clostridia bacterium]
MKSHTKLLSIFLIILLLLSAVPLTASAATVQYSYYKGVTNNDKMYIKSVSTTATGDIIIPEKIAGCFVVAIEEEAFKDCEDITSITIPETVTSIGKNAFLRCEKLESVYIPSSVTSIGDPIFSRCPAITNITVAAENENFVSENNILFTKDKTKLLTYAPMKTETSYTVPDTVTKICDYAFYKCANLTSVNLPDSVEYIGKNAFYGCSNLKNFVIPDKVSIIETYTFAYCENLETVFIPNSITSIGDCAFSNCEKLSDVVLSEGLESLGRQAFYVCSSLTEITIPGSLKKIGYYPFGYCINLERVDFHYGITAINIGMFLEVSGPTFPNFRTITIPRSATKITNSPNKSFTYINFAGTEEEAKQNNVVKDLTFYSKFQYNYCCENADNQHRYTCEITTPATHNTEGVMTYICACCDTYTEAIPKLEGHTYETVVTAPTCTEQGYTTFICGCGDSYVADYVDERGHEYTSEITTPSTHLAEGVETFTCGCGDSYTEKIATLEGHTYETAVTAPTCTEKGYTTYTCACGYSYTADFIEAYGHGSTDWVNDEENGTATRECSRCDYIETVPLTNQGDGDVEIIAPENPEMDFVIDNIEANSDQFLVIEKIATDNLRTDWKVLKAFDITLKNSDGVHVQPDGTVKVKLPLDWEKDGNYKVYRVNDDGTLTDMNAYRQGSHMVFDTDHFSIYVIVEENVEEETPSTEQFSISEFLKKIFCAIKDIIKIIIVFFYSIGDYT